jgi:MEMO1 family protein
MRQATRRPAVAGSFYPDSPRRLESAVRSLLADAPPPRGHRPLGLALPHAGYVFSGQVAADGWRQAEGRGCDLVVILGTNHTTATFSGISVFIGAGFLTPLGLAAVDEEAAGALLAADHDACFDPLPHEREHSIEVQLPFVQVLFPGTPILPVIVDDPDPHRCARFGVALANVVRGRRALIVASSDLSHYPTLDDARALDRAVLEALARLDGDALAAVLAAGRASGRGDVATCACGEPALLALLAAVRTLGATRGTVLSHATSGDAARGDRRRVVGYGAVSFTAGEPGADLAALDAPPRVPHTDHWSR